MIKRGEIYDYDFGFIGSDNRQAGRRPAVVIQTDLLNGIEGYTLTLVVPLTTKVRISPSYVRIEPTLENGLTQLSFAKCEQIVLAPIKELEKRHGEASKETMFQINQALRLVLGLA